MTADLLVDLAAADVGGRVLEVSDEYLNPAERLLAAGPPARQTEESSDRGPRRDGWETRRGTGTGHDWAIIRLGIPGVIRRVVIDADPFAGDVPEAWSVEAIAAPGDPGIVDLVRNRSAWRELVPRSPVRRGAPQSSGVVTEMTATHVRLVVYPDGGLGRFRCLGDPVPPPDLADRGIVDLAALANGARVVDVSDPGAGSPNAMLARGEPDGTGWLTRRRRQPGSEWAVVRLAARGRVERLQVDTRRFKGHAPRGVEVEAIDAPGAHADDLRLAEWRCLLPRIDVEAGKRMEYTGTSDVGGVTHLRLILHPDGGVSRFRAFGVPEVSPAGST